MHDVFHVSQLRRCFKDPIRGVNHEELDIQEDLTYREHPVRILDEAERKTRNKSIKFLKIQWSNHSEEGDAARDWWVSRDLPTDGMGGRASDG